MIPSHSRYGHWRWILTIVGLILYVVDIGTDIGVGVQFYANYQLVWSGLTLLFVLVGLVVTQIFSYAWYSDDMNNPMVNPEGNRTTSGMSKAGLVSFHLFGMGLFTRYYHLLNKGFQVVFSKVPVDMTDDRRDYRIHLKLFGLATDLSMLKLFETFLESVPQLLLQLYIILGHSHRSILQYISVACSFVNIAWALVDYRRCLRRSLPHVREMPSGLPTGAYLLYKLFTITTHILSYSLLLLVSSYSLAAMALVWLLATFWAHYLHTHFCSSRGLEWLYRGIIGLILSFTFFNAKGQNTKRDMILYYVFYSLVNFTAPFILTWLRPELKTAEYFLPVTCLIYVGTLLGLFSLVLYYIFLHPRGQEREADEVDGQHFEPDTMHRIRSFLQP
ncbi:XK-related protein 9 [Aplochiton taeniatus]